MDVDVDMMDVDDSPSREFTFHSDIRMEAAQKSRAPEKFHLAVETPQNNTSQAVSRAAENLDKDKNVNTLPIMVLDTNFMISNLALLEKLRELAPDYSYKIIIPYWTIQELDNLKDRRDIRDKVRQAISWIQKYLSVHDQYVLGQQLTQIMQVNLRGDDSILDCCLYFQAQYNALAVILTNDNNLCVKALVHGIRTVSFKKDMTAVQVADLVQKEAQGIKAIPLDEEMQTESDMSLHDKLEMFEEAFLTNISKCIDKHLHQVYDEAELEYFGYDASDFRCTEDLADFIQKWSFSVFSPLVPKPVVSRAKNLKAPLSQQEMANFIDAWGAVWMHLASKQEVDGIKDQLALWKKL